MKMEERRRTLEWKGGIRHLQGGGEDGKGLGADQIYKQLLGRYDVPGYRPVWRVTS